MAIVKKIPQVTDIGFWRAVGESTTSERGHGNAKRTTRPYFSQLSIDGYALGINVLRYAMTLRARDH